MSKMNEALEAAAKIIEAAEGAKIAIVGMHAPEEASVTVDLSGMAAKVRSLKVAA
jgi:hypothetical protein